MTPNIINNHDLWQSVLAQMQFHVSKASFATWFQSTEIAAKEDRKITISVPNTFSREWLSNKYYRLILKMIREKDDSVRELEFVIKPKPMERPEEKGGLKPKIESEQLRFDEFKIDKETNLNPRYTFDNFVVGSFNELAHAAAMAVAENTGQTYNPLFIYGGVGLGKTHLIQAVGNKVAENNEKRGMRVRYIPSEKFVSGVVASIRNNSMESFKAKLSPIDVLILDDVQFIAGKNKCQEEFFHIFNFLYEKNKQIVLSSDKPPNAIPELEERLRSRFEGGMTVDISLPDYETRLAILKTKLQERGLNLSEDVLEYVASNIKKNIRELEGALNNLLVHYKTTNEPPNLEAAKNLLKNFVFSPFNIANYKKIMESVAKFYNIDEKTLFNPTRQKEIVRPRQVAMFLLREELKYSFPAIARKFGGKDHTTVIYAHKKIQQEVENNGRLTGELNLIKQRIYSG